jgi:signal transduction histidine kinase
MTIRARLSLWYAAVMFAALMLMGILLYYQLMIEPRQEARQRHERRRAQSFAPSQKTGEGPSNGNPEDQETPLDPDVFEDVASIVLWCGVPAGLLALAGGWWLMRQALAPVAVLTQAAQRINDRNLSEQLPRSGNRDELDRLAEVLNAMTARLHDSFSRIHEFTLHASHELKTPLTVMHGELETLLRDDNLPAAQREHLFSQLDEVQRLAKIVDGLTLLTKADAGQIVLAKEPVRLDDLVRDALADARILAEPHGITVEPGACDEVTIHGDRHRLRQLLLNLADNAIKYNQPEGRVLISLRATEDQAELVISNTGPGIAPEALPRIFDRFYRGDPAHGGSIEGSGLGLSIAQWIVSAHNGSIRIESVPTKMTTVTVRLPVAH